VIPKLRNTLPEQQATFPPNQDPAVIEWLKFNMQNIRVVTEAMIVGQVHDG
jgi:hypothetical protein